MGRPSCSIAAKLGPFFWMQATTGRNPRGCLRTRATNCPSAPPMANWFTICRTGTGCFTPPPEFLESCVLSRPKGSCADPGRFRLEQLAGPSVAIDARGERAQRVQEPGQRVPRELLAHQVPDQRGKDGARLVRHLAVPCPPRRPERASDEPQHPEQADHTQLPQHLEFEVVGHVGMLDWVVDRRVLLPGGEERRLPDAQERPLLEDPLRDLPGLQAALHRDVLLEGADG